MKESWTRRKRPMLVSDQLLQGPYWSPSQEFQVSVAGTCPLGTLVRSKRLVIGICGCYYQLLSGCIEHCLRLIWTLPRRSSYRHRLGSRTRACQILELSFGHSSSSRAV